MRPTSTSSVCAASRGVGTSTRRTRRRARRAAPSPARARAAPPVSIQTASAWPTRTGTRTVVALSGSSGSSRILRVSARSFDSSSVSSPSHVQSIARSCSAGGSARSCLHPLRARAGDRLVGRDAHAPQPGRVVQRLEHAGERDRASSSGSRRSRRARAPRAPAPFTSGTTSGIAVLEPVRARLVDDDRAAARPRAGRARATRDVPTEKSDEVEIARGERLRRRLLDGQLAVAVATAPPAERADANARTFS